MITTFLQLNILCLGIFALVYHLIYRYADHFTSKRIFLLLSAGLSICIPFIHFDVFPNIIELNNSIRSGSSSLESSPQLASTEMVINPFTYIYWTGVIFAFLLLTIKSAILIFNIIRSEKRISEDFVLIRKEFTASFFKFIFIEDDDPVKLKHEILHYKRQHSLDRIVFELLLCLTWFNPFMYLYRYFIIENHEFEADQLTMESLQLQKVEYGAVLINTIKNTPVKVKMANSFHSLIKNRIKMLSNQTSNKLAHFLMIPIGLIIFSAFTFKSYPVYVDQTKNILSDTIPGNIDIIDTIAVFDHETGRESISIVKSEQSLESYLEGLNFSSGEYFYSIDTIFYFDNETEKEITFTAQSRLPKELESIYNTLSSSQRSAVFNQYGGLQTINSINNSFGIRLFPSKKTYSINVIQNKNIIKSINIEPNTTKLDFEQLYLNHGEYTLRRSDTSKEITISIIE